MVASTSFTDHTIKSLVVDIRQILRYLSDKLPRTFITLLSAEMMPPLSSRIEEQWLNPAIPTSLDKMEEYQKTLALVSEFALHLEEDNWPGSDLFHDWVKKAAKRWIDKRKETSLDWIRAQLSLGWLYPLILSDSESGKHEDCYS